MDTVNIVLMVILASIIGFAIGNVWGKESMRRTLSGLLAQLTDGMKKAVETEVRKKGE